MLMPLPFFHKTNNLIKTQRGMTKSLPKINPNLIQRKKKSKELSKKILKKLNQWCQMIGGTHEVRVRRIGKKLY